MDTMMLVLTVASLVVAVASATIAWQVTRAERQRRTARVAALAAAAGLSARPTAAELVGPASVPVPTPVPVPAGLHDFMNAHDEVAAPERSEAATDPYTPVSEAEYFAPRIAASGSAERQRWLLGAVGVFAAVVIAFAGIGFLGSRAVTSVSAPQQLPLELVALSHNRAEGALAVAGLVRNPVSGGNIQNLTAEVRVFDAAGILIGTRSTPVEAATLVPGQEATFAVTLGELVTAARYRVSFHAAGNALPHVDRRTNQPAAVTAEAR